jgi:hypothetical protein
MLTVGTIINTLNNQELYDKAVDEGKADFPNIPEIAIAIIIENYRNVIMKELGLPEGE